MSWPDVRSHVGAISILAIVVMGTVSCRSATRSAADQIDEPPRVSLPDVEGHGLAIRTHDTTASLERVHEVIEDLPAERLTDEAWSSHGIEIIRIRESDQAFIHARLPAASPPGLRWHGQAITWRNMLPSTVPINGRSILHEQGMLEHDLGNLGISGRGWSMMTIDGPRIVVELAPLIEVPGDDPDFIPSLRREFLIGPGDVLLLVGGSGVWPHPPPEDTSDEAMDEAASKGTFGQLLFRRVNDEGDGQRVMMIVPRFGESRAAGDVAIN